MPRKSRTPVERTIALCYIRQSFTRDNDDKNSPERQQANTSASARSTAGHPNGMSMPKGTSRRARSTTVRAGWPWRSAWVMGM